MGWFNKKEGEGRKSDDEMSLPELPKLPDLPDFTSPQKREQIHKLPIFPNSSFGDKFSQNTIKEAVKGSPKPMTEEKEDENFEVDDFSQESQMIPQLTMPKPKMPERKQEISERKFVPQKTKEIRPPYSIDLEASPREEIDDFSDFKEENFKMPEIQHEENFETSRIKRIEPVFIRIDKFEASLKAFEKTKKEIADMEKILKNIGEVKEEEEKQLQSWQHEIMRIKEQIDKIDKDIFSKIE
ncbi:MAG: hypothetical protein AABW50_04130 [Nanoarchaeota archaeon]|mgnify:CR=1 FL=1